MRTICFLKVELSSSGLLLNLSALPPKKLSKYLFQFKSTGRNSGITPSYYQDIISPSLPFFEDWALERLSKGRVEAGKYPTNTSDGNTNNSKSPYAASEKLKYRNTSTQKEVQEKYVTDSKSSCIFK